MSGNPLVTDTRSGDELQFDCTIKPAKNETGSPEYTVQWLTGPNFTVILNTTILTDQVIIDKLSVAILQEQQKQAIVNYGVSCC